MNFDLPGVEYRYRTLAAPEQHRRQDVGSALDALGAGEYPLMPLFALAGRRTPTIDAVGSDS